MADFTAAGDQLGCAAFISAAIPLRCGQDIDVPDIMLKLGFCVAGSSSGHAARTLTPGPVISGFNIPGDTLLGPLEEKSAMEGENGVFSSVPPKAMLAVGVLVLLMYSSIFSPSSWLT
ncbi:hypothetical protein IEQ34_001287 [Dendrobium chrysotoxum]|uniref:Uncharacterized protein n=1 Tax=Dendrobium chrysotoxum TaxID=161865 RepID=A0AAV7HPN0_DENCH|nr:hypothetical protein IEQ34_001287 [Dendrobium chrysotoxum]